MKRARARSCPSDYRRKKKIRSWDDTAKEAEQLLDKLKSSEKTSEKSAAPVPETREQRIQSMDRKIKTLGEVLKLLEALVKNLEEGDTLSLQKAERSVKRKRHQNSELNNHNNKHEERTKLPKGLEVTVFTRCPICGKTRHKKLPRRNSEYLNDKRTKNYTAWRCANSE